MSRLCIHTITTKTLSLEACLRVYPRYQVSGITLWESSLAGCQPSRIAGQIQDAGLQVVSLCRGGFFPAVTAGDRQEAINNNLRQIELAYTIGAPMLVLVCGAVPGQRLDDSRCQITDGIAAILPQAQQAGVKLAIEPLHPMYADHRSAINTMRQAHQICDALGSPASLGIAVDVYHVWWDPNLQAEIELAGKLHRLFAFHLCDWLTPTTDLLNDRGLMGEGCIDLSQINVWMEAAGFTGFREVEIFSNRWWSQDPATFLTAIRESYRSLYPSD